MRYEPINLMILNDEDDDDDDSSMMSDGREREREIEIDSRQYFFGLMEAAEKREREKYVLKWIFLRYFIKHTLPP